MNKTADEAFAEAWKILNIDYDTQTTESKVNTLRFCLPQLSILKETKREFSEPWALENEILVTQQKYAYLMDDNSHINNYADAILPLNKGFKNESKKWRCNLKTQDFQSVIPSETLDNSKYDDEYAKLVSLLRSKKVEKNDAKILPNLEYKKNSEIVSNFNILDEGNLFSEEELHGVKNNFSLLNSNKCEATSSQSQLRGAKQNYFFGVENQKEINSKPLVQINNMERQVPFQQLQSQSRSFNFAPRNERQIPSKGVDRQKKYPWERLRNSVEGEVPKCPSFKTASHQLEIENMKKFGTGRGAAPKDLYGNPKRSLGSRGIKSRFIPPVRKDDDSEEANSSLGESTSSPYAELMTNERLKNIDVKMVELIMNEIMDHGSPVAWDDIAGLELAKNTIQEIVVWPMLRPDIFVGLRGPPKGILLFGPPGTGKTMIGVKSITSSENKGKCIASQSQSTFFSISASSLTSKWIGEGEKMVRAMFAVAKCHQPAVIFIDEIDSLLTQRSDTEHESSRRLKTEFLVQLDGATTGDDERILVVGATNRPQELDEAARRRLVKRLYIPLPDAVAREQIIRNLLANQNHDLCEEDIKNVGEMADGYSGADMANLCREAALGPIRSIKFTDIQHISVDEVRPISIKDFVAALKAIRASVSSQDLNLYEEWNKKYGINSN